LKQRPTLVRRWRFDRIESGRQPERHERTAFPKILQDAVLSLTWWIDEKPLKEIVARDGGRAYRRSDWRKDDWTVEFKINFLKPDEDGATRGRWPGTPVGAHADRLRGHGLR
jgi:hypothetical protein